MNGYYNDRVTVKEDFHLMHTVASVFYDHDVYLQLQLRKRLLQSHDGHTRD